MGNIIQFKRKAKRTDKHGNPIIIKIVDGKEIECIDLDALSAAEREKYFESAQREGK